VVDRSSEGIMSCGYVTKLNDTSASRNLLICAPNNWDSGLGFLRVVSNYSLQRM